MKFGPRYCNIGPYTDPARAVELVQALQIPGVGLYVEGKP